MRLMSLIKNDIRFQYRYGFYLLYALVTLIYIGIVYALPQGWRGIAVAVVVFTDPAALGMFFMGGLILFEKSENVLNSVFISPMKNDEYIIAKVFSLSVISTLVGLVIVASTISLEMIRFIPLVTGLVLGSVFFSLVGLIVATKISSLNQFMIAISPFQLILSIPPFLYLFGLDHFLFLAHPGIIMLKLFMQGVSLEEVSVIRGAMGLIFWIILAWLWVRSNIKAMVKKLGGIRL